ncbi:MAG TPA: serine/threonine-protein kinase, partial [Thermoanaerobaculia bacterium]|nr:serine/threonine-protein kinase [Thermoanaerobaculia bacterium]
MRRLEVGDQLGRYKILKRLGAGAMGEVYLAEDPQIGRQIALKTVRVEEGKARDLEERKMRLLREARAAGRLLHPNIVALFDAGEDQGILYLAFEFVEGKDLADRVADGPPLSLGETLSIVRQAADALDAAHRQGVVHRDIKPSNLLITADGRVKIADFGIARVADQTSDLTMTGSVVGSPHYMSPEQIRGEELDGRTDIFSLGVLFYEILCRRRPFEGETLTTLVYQILNQDPTPIVVRRPDLGPRLEQLVGRMMHKDRGQRFASAAEVVREIAECEREISADRLASAVRPDSGPIDATVRMPDDASTAVRPSAPAPAAPAPPAGPAPAQAPPPAPAAAAAPRSRSTLIVLA